MMGPPRFAREQTHFGQTARYPALPRPLPARQVPAGYPALPSVIVAPDPPRPSPLPPPTPMNEPTLVITATARRLRLLHDQLPRRVKFGTVGILLISILVFAAGVARWVSRPTTAMLDAPSSERR
jgi:hypothetical protein